MKAVESGDAAKADPPKKAQNTTNSDDKSDKSGKAEKAEATANKTKKVYTNADLATVGGGTSSAPSENASTSSTPGSSTAEPASETDEMKARRVLLADSHLNVLSGVHSLLETLFGSVLMVADQPSLIDAVATHKPDLVVVDLSLPREGETDIARQLLGSQPDLRLIVLSVHDELTVARQLLNAGVAGFVLKRSASTDLIPAVREVLRGGTYVSPALLGAAP